MLLRVVLRTGDRVSIEVVLCLLVIVKMATLGIKSVRVAVCEYHNLCFTFASQT